MYDIFECHLLVTQPVVDVEPLRVVRHRLGLERHPRHEAEGLVEVLEGEGLGDGVPEQGIGI